MSQSPLPGYSQYPQQAPPAPPQRPNKGLLIFLTIFSACTFVGLLCSIAYSAYDTYRFNKTTKELEARIESLTERVSADSEISSTVKTLSGNVDAVSKKVDDLSATAEYLGMCDKQFWIADDMYYVGVTDQFTVTSIHFCADNVVMMDLDTQPSFADNYLGKGKFKISNDNLKQYLLEMMSYFKTVYTKVDGDNMTDFSALDIQIMINGYDIANYKGGTMTLK